MADLQDIGDAEATVRADGRLVRERKLSMIDASPNADRATPQTPPE